MMPISLSLVHVNTLSGVGIVPFHGHAQDDALFPATSAIVSRRFLWMSTENYTCQLSSHLLPQLIGLGETNDAVSMSPFDLLGMRN